MGIRSDSWGSLLFIASFLLDLVTKFVNDAVNERNSSLSNDAADA